MSSTLQSSDDAFQSGTVQSGTVVEEKTTQELTPDSASDLFLRHRLKIVEDLWESVLHQECGQTLVDLLRQLRSIRSVEGDAFRAEQAAVLSVIENLDLNEAIRAARAFALYFQLINIVEQHYEQRGQQQQYRAAYEQANQSSFFSGETSPDNEEAAGNPQADQLEKNLQAPVRREVPTLQALFPKLQRLNVPPRQIQQ